VLYNNLIKKVYPKVIDPNEINDWRPSWLAQHTLLTDNDEALLFELVRPDF
jgi:hypothetical protein